jgi:hypothetical protein
MLVNAYLHRNGLYHYVTPNSEDDRAHVEGGPSLWQFVGQKEETFTMPKKKVMKYRWVYNSLFGNMAISDYYYSSKEEISKIFGTIIPIQRIDSTGTLMDEDKNSL